MNTNKHKLWFSILEKENPRYTSDEPNFIDIKNFDWIEKFENIHRDIKAELSEYIQQSNLKSYFNTKMSEDVTKWKTISLKWWSLEFYTNQKRFPKTTKFINQIPGLVSASINLLEPNSVIYPHCGDTNGIYRMHLGLIIPASLPQCGFKVEKEEKSWEEGKWLAFIDAKLHEAWNHTNQQRYIFVIDIIRPNFMSRKQKIILTTLTGLFLQKGAEKYPFLYNLQNVVFLKKVVVSLLLPFCYIAIKIRNLMSKYGLVS